MKKIALVVSIAFCTANALHAQVPDLSATTLGTTIKKVITALKSNGGYGHTLYDTATGKSPNYFYPTIHYPGAYHTNVIAYPNTLQGKDSVSVNVSWQVEFVNKPTGTSNGFDAEMAQLAASLKQAFPKAQWVLANSVIIENGISIDFGKRFNNEYKLPDDIHMTLYYRRTLPIPSADNTVRLLNKLDSTINIAATPRHAINYCVSAYAHMRQEGILPEEIAHLFAPMLSRLEDRFAGIAWAVLMRLPFDADIQVILPLLSPKAQASAKADAKKAVDDYYAQWQPKEPPKTQPQAQPVQSYYKPQYMVCDYCHGKGSTTNYIPVTDYNDYGAIRIFKHSTKTTQEHCSVCRGTGLRIL